MQPVFRSVSHCVEVEVGWQWWRTTVFFDIDSMFPQQQFDGYQQNTKGKGKGPQQPYKKQIFGERVTKFNVADQRSNPWEDVSFGIGEPDLQHSEPSDFNSYAGAVALDQVHNGLQEELRQGNCCALFLKSLGSREADKMGRQPACVERILGMDCSEKQSKLM